MKAKQNHVIKSIKHWFKHNFKAIIAITLALIIIVGTVLFPILTLL